jgi:hypothetical protein
VSEFEAYGVGAVALIGFAFYVLRRVRPFAIAAALVAAAFVIATYPPPPGEMLVEWYVLTMGIAAEIVGLLFVRTMLARSVSLHLLAHIDGLATDSFERDIDERVGDLRGFRLVRTIDGRNTLTAFGRLIAAVVAFCYSLLKIDG